MPIPVLATRHSHICGDLPAVPALTGCDLANKFDTKYNALKAHTETYLSDFRGELADKELLYVNAEEYLARLTADRMQSRI